MQNVLSEELTVDATATHVRWKGHDGAEHEIRMSALAAVIGTMVVFVVAYLLERRPKGWWASVSAVPWSPA